MQDNHSYSLELLADYVAGLVDDQTHEQISNSLEKDEDLAATVSGMIQFYELNGSNHESLLAFVNGNSAPPFRESTPVRKLRPAYLFVAAAAAVLIILTFWFVQPGAASTVELVAQHSTEQYDPAVTVRGEENERLNKLVVAYSEGDFQFVIDDLSGIELDELGELYLGLALFNSGQYEKAIPSLTMVEQSDSRYAEHARWYLALAHANEKSFKDCAALLNRIISDKSYKADQAYELVNSDEFASED